jgi:hypothetical protein
MYLKNRYIALLVTAVEVEIKYLKIDFNCYCHLCLYTYFDYTPRPSFVWLAEILHPY